MCRKWESWFVQWSATSRGVEETEERTFGGEQIVAAADADELADLGLFSRSWGANKRLERVDCQVPTGMQRDKHGAALWRPGRHHALYPVGVQRADPMRKRSDRGFIEGRPWCVDHVELLSAGQLRRGPVERQDVQAKGRSREFSGEVCLRDER